jgi:hypothetical protein
VHVVPLDSVEQWLEKQSKGGKLIDLKLWSGLHFLL